MIRICGPDEQLLAPLLEAARYGRRAVSDAEAAAAGAQAELNARVSQLEIARGAQKQADERLKREERESDEAIARHREALGALPSAFVPAGTGPMTLPRHVTRQPLV